MPFYSADWIAAAVDPNGPALRLRLLVRDKWGFLRDLTTADRVKGVSSLEREVEDAVGIMKGQLVKIAMTRSASFPESVALDGRPCMLTGKFGELEAPLVMGTIEDPTRTSDATLEVQLADPMTRLVEAEFAYDAGYYPEGFAGNVYTEDSGTDYQNDWDSDDVDEGVQIIATGSDAQWIPNRTWTIEFTSATGFDVLDHTGAVCASGTIGSDLDVARTDLPAIPLVRIRHEGWSTSPGAYAAGDTFTFRTSSTRSGDDLSPVGLLRSLIDEYAQVTVADVLGGGSFSSPRYEDATTWEDALTATASQQWMGTFRRGDSVAEAIQGILQALNWAMFCAPDGRLALRRPVPGEGAVVGLRGDRTPAGTNILSASRTDSRRNLATAVRFRFLDADGVTWRTVENRGDAASYPGEIVREFTVPWIVPYTVMRTAASQTRARLQTAWSTFNARTTFAGAAVVPGEAVDVHDPAARIHTARATVAKVRIDPVNDTAQVAAFIDPLAADGYFRFGGPDTDPVGSRFGGPGDPGAAQFW